MYQIRCLALWSFFVRVNVLNSAESVIIDGTRLLGVCRWRYNSVAPIKEIQRHETVSKSEK